LHDQKEKTASAAHRLRQLLENPEILLMAACFDAMSAKLVESAGFAATFMSGFGVAATRLGLPDTGLISYGELLDQGRNICHAVSIPVLGDGDTGFGNEMNVRRTVQGYYQAGFACVMIEDQVMPKRCGHTAGKAVVERNEALRRIKAAVDAREAGADILIMARTDARATLGLKEAIERCKAFVDAGSDITFLEAPQTEAEMRIYCKNVSGYKMANLIEDGKTPLLPVRKLEEMGYKIAVYALTLLNASIGSMQHALVCLKRGETVPGLMNFKTLRQIVGFDAYDAELDRYHAEK
jgi:2-methylisocitrate lyase-like PEP mutase family enzyme